MLTNEELDAMPEATDPEWDSVFEQAKEANQLRQRCEDLELMLRAALSHHGTSRLSRFGSGFLFVHPARDGYVAKTTDLSDDGTGLPLLTDAARADLRGEVTP